MGARPVREIRVECPCTGSISYYNLGNRTAVLLHRLFASRIVLPDILFVCKLVAYQRKAIYPAVVISAISHGVGFVICVPDTILASFFFLCH